MSSTAIEKTFADIRQYVQDATAILQRGEYIELENLDGKVNEMCTAIAELSGDDAKAYQNDLSSLTKELDLLQIALLNSREQLQNQLSDVQNHKQANHAYQRSEALVGRGDATAKEEEK